MRTKKQADGLPDSDLSWLGPFLSFLPYLEIEKCFKCTPWYLEFGFETAESCTKHSTSTCTGMNRFPGFQVQMIEDLGRESCQECDLVVMAVIKTPTNHVMYDLYLTQLVLL